MVYGVAAESLGGSIMPRNPDTTELVAGTECKPIRYHRTDDVNRSHSREGWSETCHASRSHSRNVDPGCRSSGSLPAWKTPDN